jgi:hypothetical protein
MIDPLAQCGFAGADIGAGIDLGNQSGACALGFTFGLAIGQRPKLNPALAGLILG